jgi:transposase
MSKTNGRRMELNTAELEDLQRREGERSEPDRSEGASNSGGSPMAVPRPSIPDSEVPAKPKWRRFTADYKRSIVEQADAGQDAGAIGALLRREGLYSSHLSTWRRQGRAGELAALAPKRRGRKTILNPLVLENRKLVAANARLAKRLENAEFIIEVQKKLAALLGNPIPDTKIDEENE